MKTKNHDEKKKKHKHKKHKKEKSKRERKKSSSESESSGSEDEWVESASRKKEVREEWMNSNDVYFNDFVPTYGKVGGERKRQRLEKAEAERALEKKLLQERELNPYWKNDGCGLPMQKPGDDDADNELSFKLPSKSVGDCGYGWLKKAYDRLRQQAEEEGRTMEDVAVERWGSLEKLESLLNDAKRRMSQNEEKRDASSQRNEKRHSQGYNKYRLNEGSHASDERYHSKYSDSGRQRKEDEHRSSYKDSYRSSRQSHSPSAEDNANSSCNQNSKCTLSRESFREVRRFIPPKEDQREHHPSWKKKDSSVEKKDLVHEGHSRTASLSHSSPASSYQPAWKKKTFCKESSPRKKNFVKEQGEVKEKPFINETSKTKPIMMKAEEPKVHEESTSSDEDIDTKVDQDSVKDIVMNRSELNLLASRALRAEFWNDFQLAEQIQQNLDLAKVSRENSDKSGSTIYDGQPREEIVSAAIDSYQLPKKLKELHRGGKGMRHRKVVHVGPFKKQYFDDHLSLKEMFQTEKMTTADDQLKMYIETAASVKNSVSEDFADDLSGKISKKMDSYPSEEKDVRKAIQGHKRHSSALDRCRFCLNKPLLLKHTIVAKGEHVFICVPPYTSLVDGHCFIIPKTHVSSSLLLEENEFSELQAFKRGLSKMFFDKGQSFVFMETSINHRYFPHALVECIPMPKDTADLAPMYFKKAIDECETEWAHNKKLIDLSKKDLRHSVPKGLQFFSVEFSFGGGFAHIVEDEKNFPKHFGKEIVGGMLEIDSYKILKAKDEPMKDIFQKTLTLLDDWCKYKKYFEC